MFLSLFSTLKISLPLVFIVTILFGTSCRIQTKQKVAVRPLFENTDIEGLKAEIKRFAGVESLQSKIDIYFEDYTFAGVGISKKYQRADGMVILQRPAKINFTVEVPFVGTDIAQMTSDGEKFCVAVLYGVEEKYKRFVCGTNKADYSKLREKLDTQENGNGDEKKAISVFASLRPQHFTDALLMRPIMSDYIYVQSEFEQEETDSSTKSGTAASRLIRGYYFLDEVKNGDNGNAKIMRRFWFNRVGKMNLARQQVFDEQGKLVTDIVYGAEQDLGENKEFKLPFSVTVTRPQEKYKVTLSYKSPESVKMNKEYKPSIFILENRTNLPEVNLDEQKPQ